MKQNEVINDLSTADLMERLEETRTQYVKMKLQHAVSPLEILISLVNAANLLLV